MDGTSNRALVRTFQLALVSLLIPLSSVFFPSTTYEHASMWDKTVDLSLSDYRETTVWGEPLHFVIDHPDQGVVNRIDGADNFIISALAFDWIFWFIVVGGIYSVGLILVWFGQHLGARMRRVA